MMWNWLVSGLASDAVLYDGSPFVGRGKVLFDYAEAEGMTHFGTSAKFIDAIAKAGLKPKETHRLEKLRAVLSTGSPLAPEGFDYVYQNVRRCVPVLDLRRHRHRVVLRARQPDGPGVAGRDPGEGAGNGRRGL